MRAMCANSQVCQGVLLCICLCQAFCQILGTIPIFHPGEEEEAEVTALLILCFWCPLQSILARTRVLGFLLSPRWCPHVHYQCSPCAGRSWLL